MLRLHCLALNQCWRALILILLVGTIVGWPCVSGLLQGPLPLKRWTAVQLPRDFTALPKTSGKFGHPLMPALQFRTSNNDQVDKPLIVEQDDDGADSDGSEDLQEVYDSQILRVLSKAVVPLSASLGFAVNPSKRLAFRLASAAAGGLVGLAARQKIRTFARKPTLNSDDEDGDSGDMPPSVSRTLQELTVGNAAELTIPKIEAAARTNRVPERHLTLLFTTLFTEVILQALESPTMDLTELIEAVRFAETNKLTQNEMGDGLALAAARLGNSLDVDETGFFTEDFPEATLKQAAKLLFLADKLIGVETGYYGRRMLPALSFFTLETYQEMVTDACKQLFWRCIEGVLTEPHKYQSGEVEELRQYLTVSPTVSELRPAVMQHMILEAIEFMLNRTIPATTSPMEASVLNYDAFMEAQPILGWAREEWVATLEARTFPLFEAALRELFVQVADQPSRAAELVPVLRGRMEALRVDRDKARVLVTSLMSERNAQYMTLIDRVYNASGGAVEPAYKTMVAYAHVHQALQTLTAPIMGEALLPMPGLPFPEVVRANIYQAQLAKTGGGVAEDSDSTATGGVHADMFALTPEQRQVVRKHLAMPKLAAWVRQCIAERNFSLHAKAAYESQLTTHGITTIEWTATALDFYYQSALAVSQARAVPTQEEMDHLAALREFLGCSANSVAKVHLELFGKKYMKALTDSMTPTGVITDEYVDGLRRLQVRLGLQEADAENLFGVAARERVGPIVKDLADTWKSDTDANYRREAEQRRRSADGDSSQGPRVFMREALNLVDFLSENHKLLNRDATELSNLKVNAGGLVEPADLAGMFKHYVISRLTEPDANWSRRYRSAEVLFGRILGISTEGQMRIKESLAYTVFKNMLMEVFRRGEALDARATAQFIQLRDHLELPAETAETILKQATIGALVSHTAKLVRAATAASGKPLTPEAAQLLRTQVESAGVDWRRDLGFSDQLLTYLYALEVQRLVESGAEEELGELQSAYEIPIERAAEVVEATCKRYISQLLNLALRGAKKYDERDAVAWLKRILKYVPFVSGAVDADGNLFSEADKARLIEFYQGEMESGGDAELVGLSQRVGDVRERLRGMIHLTEDFVAPVQGIEGLLGNVKSLAQLGADFNVDEGRKTWAWG